MFAKCSSTLNDDTLKNFGLRPNFAGYAHAEILNQTNKIGLNKFHDGTSRDGEEISVYVVSGLLEFAFMIEYFKKYFRNIAKRIIYDDLFDIFGDICNTFENRLNIRTDGKLDKPALVMHVDRKKCPVGDATRKVTSNLKLRCFCFDHSTHKTIPSKGIVMSCFFEFSRKDAELISKNRMYFIKNGDIECYDEQKKEKTVNSIFYRSTLPGTNEVLYKRLLHFDGYCEKYLDSIGYENISTKDTLYIYRALDALPKSHFGGANDNSDIMSIYVLFFVLCKIGTPLNSEGFCEYQRRINEYIEAYEQAQGNVSNFLLNARVYLNRERKIKDLDAWLFFKGLLDNCYLFA